MRKIGIIGGMGPEATALLFQRLIALTPAQDDADHLPLLIDNDPRIPSRIRFLIEENGPDPSAYLRQIAQGLEAAGCAAIAMPCNTAHFFAEAVAHSVSVPLINVVECSTQQLHAQGIKRAGMFCSPALRKVGVYTQTFAGVGIEEIYPQNDDEPLQIIREIKAGNTPDPKAIQKLLDELTQAGAEVILVSCSELSLYRDQLHSVLPVVDTIDVLAENILAFATAE